MLPEMAAFLFAATGRYSGERRNKIVGSDSDSILAEASPPRGSMSHRDSFGEINP